MLNNQKIKKMHKLAVYESGVGKEDLAVSNYYRSDYIDGINLLCTVYSLSVCVLSCVLL